MGFSFERITAQPVPGHARQHMVRMRDGVRLATDVYAVEDEPAPAVLVRLPYDKNSRYVFLDRITHQTWSNGVVGMFGDSYYGFTQWSAVSSQHPALRAIVPRVTATNVAPGRALAGLGPGRRPRWLEGTAYLAHHWIDNDAYRFEPDLTVRPLAIAHMRDFTELAVRPGWAAVQYLSADATDHENYHLDQAPIAESDDHQLSDAALERMLPSYVHPALEFFDVFLKGTRSADSLARVRWYLGHVGWQTAESWPPSAAVMNTFHLAQPENATGALPGGRLVPQPPETTGAEHRAELRPACEVAGRGRGRQCPDDRARQHPARWAGGGGDPARAHRIPSAVRTPPALMIASSDFPNHVPNSGTTEDPWLTVRAKPSVQTLRTGAAMPSRVRLTVLPESRE